MKTPAAEQSLVVGTTAISYKVVYSKRKTLAIRVHPDGRVEVRAPLKTPDAYIEEVMRQRASWIVKHQQRFKAAPRPEPKTRRYVNGELYRYLGHAYPLMIVQNAKEGVRLTSDGLAVSVAQPEDTARIKALIDRWYRTQALRVFTERLHACFPRIHFIKAAFPQLSIRLMKTRWGSCTSKGKVTLNIKLLQMSEDLIDYVILHELCHLKELNHSPRFYALMDRVLPDWRQHRQRLNKSEVM